MSSNRIEGLEPRRHLSDTPRITLEITGTDGSDEVYMYPRTSSRGMKQLRTSVNGVWKDFPLRTIRDFRIRVLGGNDLVVLYSTPRRADIDGGNGIDNLKGGAGNDTIIGGADHDTILGGAGDDHLDVGPGLVQLVQGDDGNDTILGSGNDDLLVGNAGNDRIIMRGRSGHVWAGEGDDYIDTQNGVYNWIVLGGGNDTLVRDDWDGFR